MPVVSVKKDVLFKQIGQVFTEEQFDELCFEFGIELDEVTSEEEMKARERGEQTKEKDNKKDPEVIYKIDIPANRYDLLCGEGLAHALKVFLRKETLAVVKTTPATLKMTVNHSQVQGIREHIVCAVLRNITFTPESYKSFIDLQDKLHQNICRKRTLVAIGTHDLDTLTPPFTYEALPPTEIEFIPLNQTAKMNAPQLFDFYRKDTHLSPYLEIIEHFPRYPVIYDSKRTVLSLPPIINGDHSKITLNTKNVFIECTATDLTKASITLNMIVNAFSAYCEKPFSVESVEVIRNETTTLYPNLSSRKVPVKTDYINRVVGLPLEKSKIIDSLKRMGLIIDEEENQKHDDNTIIVTVPPNRPDIFHPCDIVEDVAIAVGFNNIPQSIPTTVTVGKQQPLNKLTDLLRYEIAQSGFIEILNFGLCGLNESYKFLNRPNDNKAVILDNPMTKEFEIARTSLIPGLFKTLHYNRALALPLSLFEISDVVLKDNNEVGAVNRRKLAALYCNTVSSFERIHGLLNRLMQLLEIKLTKPGSPDGYYIVQSDDGLLFPQCRADVYYQGQKIGVMGTVHPAVLKNFEITNPCDLLEIDIQVFL